MAYSTNFSIEDLHFDNYGLIPAIAQDWLDGSILMLAWMNKESLIKTLETKNVHYWSRSRSEIWRKGATSGSIQLLKEIRFDCDNDAIVLSIEQKGSGACHTGEISCFFNEIDKIRHIAPINYIFRIANKDFLISSNIKPAPNVPNELKNLKTTFQ